MARTALGLCLLLGVRDAAAGTLRLAAGPARSFHPLSLLGLSSKDSPGDVSAVDELQDTLNDIGAKKTIEVVDAVGAAVAGELDKAAAAAEETITDPVGAIGSLANRLDQNMDQPFLPTQGPTPLPPGGFPQELMPGFLVPTVTPIPAPFNGVYCRGGACQYRLPPPPLDMIVTTMAPPELCRGIGCPGLPDDPLQVSFVQNCSHLFQKYGNPLKAPVGGVGPTIVDVRGTFMQVCRNALPLEAGSCPDYADVIVAALSPKVSDKSVGTTGEVCLHLFKFMVGMKAAEIDLRLTAAAFKSMKDPGSGSSKAAAFLGRAPSPAPVAGPCTPRGVQWRRWWAQRHRGHRRLAVAGTARVATSMLQRLWRGGVGGQATYDPNPSCNYGSGAEVPPTLTHYQILPGSADGSAPPVEIRGDIFSFCRKQMLEITQDYAQPASIVVQMTRDWCGFQSIAPPPDDPNGVPRHPEWDFNTCTGLAQLVALSLRADLQGSNPVDSMNVCKRMFLTSGALHRVDFLVKKAWTVGARGPPAGGLAPVPEDDPEQQKLVEEAMRWANKVYDRLKQQKQATAAVNKAKAAIRAAQGGAL